MRALIFSNIYIALAAVAMTAESYVLLDAARGFGRPAAYALEAGIFFGTIFVYNLDRLVSASREDAVEITDRHRWIRVHHHWLWGAVGLAAVGGAVSLWWVPTDVWWALALLGAVALAYSLPVVRRGGQIRRLKDLPGLKIFLIALVWASVTVGLPTLEAGVALGDPNTLWVFAERGLFVFAITLPFDVRDLQRDRQANIRTLPMAIGPAATRWLALGLMGAFAALASVHYGVSMASATLPLVTSAVLTAASLWWSDEVHDELYYVGLLDGMMVTQGLLVIAYSHISI